MSAPPDQRARRASRDLKLLLATQLAAGHSVRELAERHGYSWRGMRRLAATKEMRALVDSETQRVLQAAERTMFRFMLAADACAEGMIRDAETPGPRQFEARKYILDRIVPSRSTQQAGVNVNLQLTREVVKELGEAIEGLHRQRPLHSLPAIDVSPNLIEGKQAFADEAVATRPPDPESTS